MQGSGIKKIKAFGQHFLNDEAMAYRIAAALDLPRDMLVLEVGPGEGVLTKHLLQRYPHLLAVEYDKRLIPVLLARFPELKGKIVQDDFLRVNLQELVSDDQYAIIGNFPYQISTGILFQVIEDRERILRMVGMFQKEVAERVAAAPGSKIYGITSILVQAYYEVEKIMDAPPSVFTPPPKVHSTLIRLTRRPVPRVVSAYSDLRKIVKVAFNQRRKTLRNALGGMIHKSEMSDEIFDRRAEELSIEEFDMLVQKFLKR